MILVYRLLLFAILVAWISVSTASPTAVYVVMLHTAIGGAALAAMLLGFWRPTDTFMIVGGLTFYATITILALSVFFGGGEERKFAVAFLALLLCGPWVRQTRRDENR